MGRTPSPSWLLNSTPASIHEDRRDEALAAVEISVQAVILVVAVVGNSFVLLVLLHQRRFRPMSRIYLFMMHLSIADLLVAAFNVLPQLAWDITYRFHGGDALCRTVKYGQVMVLYLSTYMLVMMAVDRYRAICWGAGIQCSSMRIAKLMVAGAWALAAVAAVPQAVIFNYVELSNQPGVWDCWTNFPPAALKAYVTWFVLSIFIVPLVIIAFCYGVICYRVWNYDPDQGASPEQHNAPRRRKTGIQGNRGVDIPLQPLTPATARLDSPYCGGASVISRAKMKTVKLTLVVVVCFFVCWSPFCITQLVITYCPPDSASDIGAAQVLFLLLASLNSCTNPWIYLAFSGTLVDRLRICLGLNRPPRVRPHRVSVGDDDHEPQQPHPDVDDGVPNPRNGDACSHHQRVAKTHNFDNNHSDKLFSTEVL